MADIDRLEVQVEAQATKANKQLDSLINKLEKVSSALTGVNASGLTGFANGISKIAGASAQLGNVKTADFTRLAKNLEKMAGVDQSALNRTSASLTAMSQSLGKIKGASQSATQISELAKNISKLGNKSVQNAMENMPKLASGLNDMMITLSKAPTVSNNLIQMTNALASLASQGSRVGAAINSVGMTGSKGTSLLSGWLDRLTGSTGKATRATKSFSQIAGSFYANFYVAMRGLRSAWSATESSMDFLETVNYFEVAMRKLGDDAVATWDGIGYESAEAYAKSFSERAKQLTAKMTGYEVDEDGNATYTGKKNLGMNPDTVMNYQAMFAQVSESIGVAEESALNFSTALTMLGADWASLRNTTFEQAFEKFASALAGQSRAVRAFGIDITNATLQEYAYKYGLTTAISEMNQATKAQLRLLASLDQSKVAFGDLANTMQSPSNQLRMLKQNFSNLARTIGNLFLPVVEKVLPYINGLVMAVQRLFTWIGSLLGIEFGSINSSIGGMDNGVEDLVDGVDDAEDSLNGANDAAKKLKNTILGFDEINQLNDNTDSSSGGSGSGGGIGGGSALLDEEIANALAEYQKAWDEAFDRMENKAQDISDRICKAFKRGDYEGIGKYISNEITRGLEKIEWNTVYSVSKNFGKGFAEFLNGLISPSLFGIVGKTIAGALNTAIYAELSFGENFDWKNLGNSIANGINSFFCTYDFGALAQTYNVWAKGILDAAITALDNTDWEMIGEKIGVFLAELDFAEVAGKVGKTLWKAINAAIKVWSKSFDAAPIETTIVTILGFSKAWKAITGTEFTKALKSFKTFTSKAKLLTSAFKGNQNAMLTLTQNYPKLSKVVTTSTKNFTSFKNLFKGNFFGNLKTEISNIGSKMTGLQKGVLGTVAVFGEFSLVKSGFKDIASGADNLGAAIGKIAVGAGGAAVALYTAFGPAGLVVAAITGVVGAVKGIHDAFEKIRAEEIGNAIYNAFTSPGGTSISELANGISDAFANATSGFQELNNASESVTTTNKNIQSVVSEIEQIKRAMDLGVLSVEEGKEKLDGLFGELVTLTGQKMSELTTYLLALYGEDGALSHAYEETEYSAEQLTDATIRAQYATTDAAQAIYEQMKEVDFGSSEWNELYQQLLKVSLGMSELETATFVFSDDMKSLEGSVNWEKIIDSETGEISTEELDKLLGNVSLSLEEYEKALDEAEKNTKLHWQEMLTNAATPEDKALFQQVLDDVPHQFNLMREDAEAEVTEFTNMLHRDFIVKTGDVIENAEKEFDEKSYFEKFWKSLTKEEYVQDAIDKQTENMGKLSDSIEKSFGDLGMDTAGWSADFHDTMYGSLFDINTEYLDMGVEKTTRTLKENYRNILDDVANGVDGEKAGKKIHTDINSGLASDTGSTAKAMSLMINEIGTSLGSTSAAFSSLRDNIKSTTDSSKNSVSSFKTSSSSSLSSVDSSLSQNKSNFGLWKDKLLSTFDTAITKISGFSQNANSKFDSTMGKANSLTGAIDGTTQSVQDLYSQSGKTFEIKTNTSALDTLQGAVSRLLDTVKNLFSFNGQSFSVNGGVGISGAGSIGIRGYASGGIPETGQLFMARENGINEMVGRIGNHSAVANNDQITQAFASEIRPAMTEAFVEALMLTSGVKSNDGQAPVIEVTIKADSETVYNIVRKGKEKSDRRYHVVTEI